MSAANFDLALEVLRAWPREEPTPFDESSLSVLHVGTDRLGDWRICKTDDRRVIIYGGGRHIGTWELYPETTAGDIAMLAAQAAWALRRGGGLIDCNHRKFGAQESLSYASFKQLVERSEFIDFGMWGTSRGWRSECSGGPPYKLWGPPLAIEDPSALLAYDELSREWASTFDVPRRWADPCPLDVVRPYVRAWPEPTIAQLRDGGWSAFSAERPPRDAENELCARFAERLGRPDIAHWHRTGSLPAPKPRPLSEWSSGWDSVEGEREWVYVLRESDGDRVKIGKSEVPDPMLRIRSHQTSSSQGRHLEIVAVMLGARGLERRMHDRFRRQLVPGKTEWFFERGALRTAVGDRFVNVAVELLAGVFLP